jgi:RNA polymerase sigma-70 factor, ECF subfamily
LVVADDAYLSRLRSGSEADRDAALGELRQFLRRALARSFAGKLGEGDLDDLAQESLLRVHSRLHTFEQQSRFTTWATAIAVNCALSELRRRRFHHTTLEDAAARGHAALVAESEVAGAETELALARLRRGIADALTERQREATLALLGELPLMEIARRLETTQGAVYKLLHDARKRLKRYLETGDATPLPSNAGPP